MSSNANGRRFLAPKMVEMQEAMKAQAEKDRRTDHVVTGPVPFGKFLSMLRRYRSVKVVKGEQK